MKEFCNFEIHKTHEQELLEMKSSVQILLCTPDCKLEPSSNIVREGLSLHNILEDGSSLLTQVYNTYNNSDNNRYNPLKLNVFSSNQTP